MAEKTIQYQCIICKNTIAPEQHVLKLDPCALIVVSNINKAVNQQKEQTFFCHFECFKHIVNDESLLYLTTLSTPAEREAEDSLLDTHMSKIFNFLQREGLQTKLIQQLFQSPKGVWQHLTDFDIPEAFLPSVTTLEEYLEEPLLIMWSDDYQKRGQVVLVSANSWYDYIIACTIPSANTS